MTSELSDELRRFILENVPDVDAAELLLLIAGEPARQWKPQEVVEHLRPIVMGEASVRTYLAVFHARGLVAKQDGDCFQYRPASLELEAAVQSLVRAYNERPVTLIRTIYGLREKGARRSRTA